jgi:glycosyltransferase involved in cell wall biosynthesis
LFFKTDYFLANDLDCLIPCYYVAKIKGKFLFYDTHEYFTGIVELDASPVKKKIWKFFEDRLFPRMPIIYTVNNSVKKKYDDEYGKNLFVVRNVPITVSVAPMQKPFRWEGKKILLMQGTGINPGRGGLLLLEIMKHLSNDYLLVLIGGGTQWNLIAEKRIEWKLEDKVEMIDKLKPSVLKQYTPLADLGFCMDNTKSDNNRLSLPNKIFDYIHAGIPVAATPVPEVKNIIDQYKVGFCFQSDNADDMAKEITKFLDDKLFISTIKANTTIAAKELCWEKEKQKLTAIYEPYL